MTGVFLFGAALAAMDRLTDATRAGRSKDELDRLQRAYDIARSKAQGQEAAMVCRMERIPYRGVDRG